VVLCSPDLPRACPDLARRTAVELAWCSIHGLGSQDVGLLGPARPRARRHAAPAPARLRGFPRDGVGHCRCNCRAFPRDGAEPGGVLRRPQARQARRVRGGGRHNHEGVGGCNRSAVRQPDGRRRALPPQLPCLPPRRC
jgi:hypothetical protein